MYEKCRRARAGQGRGDLAADVAALAHAHHHHAAAAFEHATHRLGKTFALARSQAQQGARLDFEGTRCQFQGAGGVEGVCGARRARGHRRRSHKIGPF
jgi:hypothetical protein